MNANKETYMEIADIINGVSRRHPECRVTVAELINELVGYFADKDEHFPTAEFATVACGEVNDNA